MSTSQQKLPLSAVIFDRTMQGLSDVPVFSEALKRKINTPSSELKESLLSPAAHSLLAQISRQSSASRDYASGVVDRGVENQEPREKQEKTPSDYTKHDDEPSVLRADPDRGQTSVSARRTGEGRPVGYQLQGLGPIRSVLYEDPVLIQTQISPEELRARLSTLSQALSPVNSVIIGAPQYPRVQISKSSQRLQASSPAGLIDRVIIPDLPASALVRFEEYELILRREVWRLTLGLKELQDTWPEKKEKLEQFRQELLGLLMAVLEHAALIPARIGRPIVGTLGQVMESTQELSQTPIVTRLNLPKSPDLVVLFSVRLQSLQSFLQSLVETTSISSLSHLASRVMIISSMVLMLFTVGPMVALEANSWKQKIVYSIQNLSTKAADNTQSNQTGGITSDKSSATPTPTPIVNPDPDKQFQIIIPKIGVNSKVIANVDPSKESEYMEALKKGVAHAAGTGLPGEANSTNKTIFIFGHSTNGSWNIRRYNALFYNLKDMVAGDTFTMWFWGKEFTYIVKEVKIAAAEDISFLTPQTQKDQLILQTCWPPGTSWKRLLVIAEPVK